MSFIQIDFNTNVSPIVGDTYTLTQTDSFGVDNDLIFTLTADLFEATQPYKVLYLLSTQNQNITNATNFETALIRDLNPAIYSVVRVDNIITITSLNENLSFTAGASTFNGVAFSTTIEPTVLQRINVRSPFFISAPIYDGSQIIQAETVTFEVYIYTGVLNVSKPTTPTYTYEKKPRFSNDTNIYIDVSRQVNDYIENIYNGTLLTQSVFVEIETTTTYFGGTLTQSNEYLALNGFNLHSENVNHLPTNEVLISNSTISVLSGQDINIPIYLGGIDTLEINAYYTGQQTAVFTETITPITIVNTDEIVVNVDIPNFLQDGYIEIENQTTNEIVFFDVEVVTECIYEPVKITFLNRHGVLQDFYSYKVSKETIKSISDKYNRSVLKESVVNNIPIVSYSTTEHNTVNYNKQATKSIELNTGYIPEDNNVIIEEMTESEYVWLTIDNVIIPANLSTKSVPLLTKINDQLIKYKLNFDYSYNEVQNIR